MSNNKKENLYFDVIEFAENFITGFPYFVSQETFQRFSELCFLADSLFYFRG